MINKVWYAVQSARTKRIKLTEKLVIAALGFLNHRNKKQMCFSVVIAHGKCSNDQLS